MSYKIVKSDQNMLTAVNEKDKKVIIAFKGTSNATDLVHDVQVGLIGSSTSLISKASAKLYLPHRFNTARNYVRNA
jgi:hypothetical protein